MEDISDVLPVIVGRFGCLYVGRLRIVLGCFGSLWAFVHRCGWLYVFSTSVSFTRWLNYRNVKIIKLLSIIVNKIIFAYPTRFQSI